MKKYRKKPVVIEAIQLTKDNQYIFEKTYDKVEE